MRLALVGYRRTGKDTVGEILVRDYGYTKRSVGSIVKDDLDPLITQHLGFSSHTEVDEQKERIRPVLEEWALANNDSILQRFYDGLPEQHVVNTRLQTLPEAQRWAANGGRFFIIERLAEQPISEFEKRTVGAAIDWLIEEAEHLTAIVYNARDKHFLAREVHHALIELQGTAS